MTPAASIRTAWRNLSAHPLRSTLTITAIGVGVASVMTMVAIGLGVQAQIAAQVRAMGSDLLVVVPGSQIVGAARLGRGTRITLTEDDAVAIEREIASVAAVAPTVSARTRIINGNANWSANVDGVMPAYFDAREWRLASGQPFSMEEVAGNRKVALLGRTVERKLFGDEPALGRTVRINDVPFTVIGTLGARGYNTSGGDEDDRVFTPLSTAKTRLIGNRNRVNARTVDFILVKVARSDAIAEASGAIDALLRQRHRIAPSAPADFSIRNLSAVQAAERKAADTLSALLAAVASVSLIVAGIGVANITLVSVAERAREIGLRMAVGASRSALMKQFLAESVFTACLGGLIGVAVGLAAPLAISEAAGWTVVVSPWSVPLSLLFSSLVGVAFGIYPAWTASRMSPVQALGHD